MEHTHHQFEIFAPLIEEPLEGFLESIGAGELLTHFLVHTLVDLLQIVFLLFVVVTIVSYIQTYIPYEKMKHRLEKLQGVPGVLLSFALGMLSPFCSCSIIPIMMGFLASGVPLSCCLIFLTSASCLNLTALSGIFAAFDLSFSIAYVICAVLITLLSTLILTRFLKSENLVHLEHLQAEHHHHHEEITVGNKLVKALCSAWLTFKEVWLFLLIGVAVSCAVTVFVPEAFIENLLSGNVFSLPLATIIGGCLHSDVFSILPIVLTLLAYSKPVALTFLLSSMLFSIAEWALLSQSFRVRLIARYCAVLLGLAFLCGLVTLLIF